MRLIIGLGNPEPKYANTRHNAGYMFVDRLKSYELGGCVAVKTDVFMNDSGLFVKKRLDAQQLDPGDLFVAHDDLDLKLGAFKIQKGKGPKDHNGLLSIYDSIGTKDFWHIRIGVDNRNPENREEGEKYVLEDFTPSEMEKISWVIKNLCEELVKLVI